MYEGGLRLPRNWRLLHPFRCSGAKRRWRTAEPFDNWKRIIKKHYQGRVSSKDMKRFYALRPIRVKPAKRRHARVTKRGPKAAAPAAFVVRLPVQVAA